MELYIQKYSVWDIYIKHALQCLCKAVKCELDKVIDKVIEKVISIMPCQFYLVGDDIATAKTLDINPQWKFEDLQRAVGNFFHATQPTGVCSLSLTWSI